MRGAERRSNLLPDEPSYARQAGDCFVAPRLAMTGLAGVSTHGEKALSRGGRTKPARKPPKPRPPAILIPSGRTRPINSSPCLSLVSLANNLVAALDFRKPFRPTPSSLVGFHKGAENCVHPGQVPSSLAPEPFQHVGIEAQMDRCLAWRRHDHPGIAPEILVHGMRRRIRAGERLAACTLGPKSFGRVSPRIVACLRHYVANATKDRHPRESGDPCGIGPRFRGDDGVVCDACEPSGVCYMYRLPSSSNLSRADDPAGLAAPGIGNHEIIVAGTAQGAKPLLTVVVALDPRPVAIATRTPAHARNQ